MCKWLIHSATIMILYAIVWHSDCCVKVRKDLHYDRWRVWRYAALITRGKLSTKTHFRCGPGRLHLKNINHWFIIEWCGIVLYLMSDIVFSKVFFVLFGNYDMENLLFSSYLDILSNEQYNIKQQVYSLQ